MTGGPIRLLGASRLGSNHLPLRLADSPSSVRGRRSVDALPVTAPTAMRRKPRTQMTTAKEAELTALNAKLGLVARQWRTTADAIDDALILIDSTDNVLRMNRAAAASLGGSSWSVWVGQASARLAQYPPWSDALDLGRRALSRNAI